MNKNLLRSSIVMSLVFLTACANYGSKAHQEERAKEVAECAAIAQILNGRSSSRVMFEGVDGENVVHRPYNPAPGSKDFPVYTTTLLVSEWFQFEDGDPNHAILKWTFDKPEYIQYKAPKSDKTPHATVSFIVDKFPKYGDTVDIVMSGEITYGKAKEYVHYNITLDNVDKSDV